MAEQWIQLSNNLHYILVSICDGPASTICRQNTQGNGFETWPLIHSRYSIPLGTRSIGYLTRLLKPQFDEQKFEESFATWEFQLSKYDQDNNTLLPDAVKIAVLLNETKGPLQEHLQLQAGNITTYAQIRSMVIEYYRATATFARLQAITSGSNNQGPAPMDIGATWYNKDKGKKGKQGQRKIQQRQRLRELREQLQLQRRKRQVQSTTGWTRKSFQRTTRIWQRKRIQQQRKRKRILQQPTRRTRSKRKARNKCLPQMAKQCRVAIYNCDTGNFNTNDQTDYWYSQAHYDNNWYHQDQTQMQQVALPQPPQLADPSAVPVSGLKEITIAMIGTTHQHLRTTIQSIL